MKCLSVLQPWASLLFAPLGQRKCYETRSWKPNYRGRLVIHAAKRFPYDTQALSEQSPFKEALVAAGLDDRGKLPRGVLLGTVELVDILPTNWFVCAAQPPDAASMSDPYRRWISPTEIAFGDWRPGRFAWVLQDPVLFAQPIPYSGRLGIHEIANLRLPVTEVVHEAGSVPAQGG